MRGSITVFMSLCLAVCLLFIGTLLESARIVMLRSKISECTEAAMDSLFAGYDGDLFDEFGILLLNLYELETEGGLEANVKAGIESQFNLNSDRLVIGGNIASGRVEDVQVAGIYPVVMSEGKLFARSVLDYMKYKIPVSMTAEILEMIRLLNEGNSVKTETEEAEDQQMVLLESEQAKGLLDEKDVEKYEELADESILRKVESLRENGCMELLLPSDRIVSERTTTKSGFPSNYYTGVSSGGGGLLSDLTNNIMYGEYLMEHFNGFTQKTENPVLMYELEYILCGNGSDKKNLEESIDRLLLMREGLNILTIYQNQTLSVQADSLAAALAGWTGIPPLIEAVKAAVIAAWAYAESIIDVRTLLAGYPVPFMKREGEWSIALDCVPELIKGTYLGIGQYENGMEYKDYLRLLLLLADEQQKYYRTMDMIQCRMSAKKPRFYMSECIYALEVDVVMEASPVFLNPFGQKNWNDGIYKIRAGASRMY